MRFDELINQFRDYLLGERAASPATVSAYMTTLSRLLEFLSSNASPAKVSDVERARPTVARRSPDPRRPAANVDDAVGQGQGQQASSCYSLHQTDGAGLRAETLLPRPSAFPANGRRTRGSALPADESRLPLGTSPNPVQAPPACGVPPRSQALPRFEDVTTADLRRFIGSLSEKGLSPATVARHIHAIRSFWRFVVETYDLGHNAALPLRAPKPEHRIPRVLTEEECRRLLEATGRRHYRLYRIRDRVLLKLMMVTGLRRGEVIQLSISDYDAKRRLLTVRHAKGRKWRIVPLPQDLCHDIDAWLEVRPQAKHDRLLTTRTGAPLTPKAIYRALRVLSELAGIDPKRVTPHILRHTAATHVLRNSGDLLATSRLLGHSSVAVTGDVYCHLDDEDVRRALLRHPLAGSARPAGDFAEADVLRVPEPFRQTVDEALTSAERALEGVREALACNAALAARWHQWCVVEAIRHNVRPGEAIAPGIVRKVAWEGGVVQGYSMAEHVRMIELRRLFSHVRTRDLRELCCRKQSNLVASGHDPWALIDEGVAMRLTELASRILRRPLGGSSIERFATALAFAWEAMRTSPEVFVVAHLLANAVVTEPTFPIVSLRGWDRPACAVAVEQTLRHNASSLLCLIASRVVELCSFVTGSRGAEQALPSRDAEA